MEDERHCGAPCRLQPSLRPIDWTPYTQNCPPLVAVVSSGVLLKASLKRTKMALTSQGTKKKVCYYYDGKWPCPCNSRHPGALQN